MAELVVALLMIVQGEIKEARIQNSMSECLKGSRIAKRQLNSRLDCSKTEKTFNVKMPQLEEELIKFFDEFPKNDY